MKLKPFLPKRWYQRFIRPLQMHINIESIPELYKLFYKWRPRDIKINAGLFSKDVEFKYYYFEEQALNTFSTEVASELLPLSTNL